MRETREENVYLHLKCSRRRARTVSAAVVGYHVNRRATWRAVALRSSLRFRPRSGGRGQGARHALVLGGGALPGRHCERSGGSRGTFVLPASGFFGKYTLFEVSLDTLSAAAQNEHRRSTRFTYDLLAALVNAVRGRGTAAYLAVAAKEARHRGLLLGGLLGHRYGQLDDRLCRTTLHIAGADIIVGKL